MHFEVLVEGQVDCTALSFLLPKILGDYSQPHTWTIHKHRGLGEIPKNPCLPPNKNNQTLLHNLPSKLRAYGKEKRDDLVVVVLVDLDDRPDCASFKKELVNLLRFCQHKPKCLFRIAIEELEAWFLGDQQAIRQAYPRVKQSVLNTYVQDSQCGTWEKLAEAIFPGGLKALVQYGKRSHNIFEQKRVWASNICPLLDVQHNQSPSFQAFCSGVKKFAAL